MSREMKALPDRSDIAAAPQSDRQAHRAAPGAAKSFAFVAALRPFSLVVALVSCGLGIRLAAPLQGVETVLAAAVMLAGLLLQCGVNLINDRADLRLLPADAGRFARPRRQIERNFRAGLASFAAAAAIGIGIALYTGLAVAAIGLLGLFGAWAYTQEPFNYKRRGLGVVFVFPLMGVLMVQGSYLAVSGEFSALVLLHSLPVSCLVSLLLLANELRDFDRDSARGVHTLSVIIGFANAARLYWLLIVAAYAIAGLSILGGVLPPSPWLLLPLPLLPLLARHLRAAERRPLTPWSGRFLLLFGVGYMLALGQP
jgi:1,4-dihydroxy-2-naphthoate octaprenyltransferase